MSKYTCTKCTMGFVVDEPHNMPAEYHKCPECELYFWAAQQPSMAFRVGVSPRALPKEAAA